MKKTSSVAIIVVCLALASVGFYKFVLAPSGGGISSLSPDKMIWVKCSNCGATYEMSQVEFFKEQKAKQDPRMVINTPGITCKECGQDKVFEAVKCPNCGNVFFRGSVRGKPDDTCPKCGFSELANRSKPAG